MNKIFEILKKLKEQDTEFKKFSADFHHYKFNSPLEKDKVNEFENIYNVSLPQDYKEFIMNIGDGGFGPYYGLESLYDSIVDFKLRNKPKIAIAKDFPYTEKWDEEWISNFDWEKDIPEGNIVDEYMDVKHIQGCLEICHYGHGCTFLLVVKGKEVGNMWFDGRADYSGIYPVLNDLGSRVTFLQWYLKWLESY